MPFYHPSDSQFTQHYREEVAMAFSAIDCILHREHVIYCSSELTTGRWLYDALRQHNVQTAAELRRKLGDAWFHSNLSEVNTARAIRFADEVRSRFEDRTMVITPAPFSAPGWTQPEYLAFWENLIRTRIKSVWFNRNWWFSNGCTFEFAVAQDAGIPTLDSHGDALPRNVGMRLIEQAIEELDLENFETATLRENLTRILTLQAQSVTTAQAEMNALDTV